MDDQMYLAPIAEPDDSDKLINMWLATKQSENTQRAYQRIIDKFVAVVNKPLRDVRLNDLIDYTHTLTGDDATKALAINAVKSLFTFGIELGYFTVNVAKPLKAPKVRSELAQRILSEADVIRMIDKETDPRNRALIHLLYHAGLRVTEVVMLQWKHIRPTDNGAVLDVWGKGSKQRYVQISKGMYEELCSMGCQADSDRYVFQGRKSQGGMFPIDPSYVDRLVLAAAKRAGIKGHVSAHWLRHSNATHASKNGATLETIKDSLGHASIVTTSRYLHVEPGTGSSQYLKI